MRILVLGGGPGGLYSAFLIKKAYPSWDISVIERNPPDATYGWGVVFSDRTLTSFREADYPSYQNITDNFVIWDAIEVRYAGQSIRCGGNIFAGISRKVLLSVLQERCRDFDVKLEFLRDVTDLSQIEGLSNFDLVIAADGINSLTRKTFAESFHPRATWGKMKYIWLGTHKAFDAFTFIFRESEYGLLQAAIYPNDGTASTVVVQINESAWSKTRLEHATEADSVAFCERVFAADLDGAPLLPNKSDWLNFPTLSNRSWRHGNIILLGDSAHTADFTIGSGTKLAMEDAIALANAFERFDGDVEKALNEYELERKPMVGMLQQAAAESSQYFENIQRYAHLEPMQFVFYLLTRSGRISYNEARRRDPSFADAVDRWFFEDTIGSPTRNVRIISPPPMLTPFRLRNMALNDRVVLPCAPTDASHDGIPSDDHRQRVKTWSLSGAALIVTEPVAVSSSGRITSGCPGLYAPEHTAAWSRVTESTHTEPSVKIGIRLNHAGRRGSTLPRTEGLDRPLGHGSWPLLSASALSYIDDGQTPKEMDRADMDQVRDEFVQAARAAHDAGFDLIQLHFAHGYLLASFISPLTNLRRDAYGGALENRLRFPLEVLDAVRAAWPDEKPLSVAISATDWVKGGQEIDEAVAVAKIIKARGCDLIEVLAGQTTMDAQPRYGPAFLVPFSDHVRNEAHLPTLASGCIMTVDQINTILAGGRADLCTLEPPQLNAHNRPAQTGQR